MPPAWQAVVGVFSHCGDVLIRRGSNVRGQWVCRERKETLRQQFFLERKSVGCKRRGEAHFGKSWRGRDLALARRYPHKEQEEREL